MRTQEQKEADEALTAAIEQVLLAYGYPPEGVLANYVVLLERKGWNDDSDPYTGNYLINRDESTASLSQILGMLEYESVRVRKSIWVDDDDASGP